MLKKMLLTTAFALSASLASAAGWTIDNDTSRIQFGSIKKDGVGESHYFKEISGGVSIRLMFTK